MAVRWLLVAGILGGGVPVAAQLAGPSPTPPPVSSPTASVAVAEPATGFGETLLVTTSVRPESSDTSTATVEVIDAAEIAARQATTVSQVLATVPGVAIAQSGSPGHVTSAFLRGTNSNQTLVLWNGIPLNDPIFGGFDWAFLPTEGVARVEVVRGPFSALYGSAAIGGVVNVLTRRTGTPRVNAALEGGSDNQAQLRAAGGDDVGPLHLAASGHLRSGDGVLQNDFFKGSEGLVRAAWSGGAVSDLGLLLRANDSEIGIPLAGGAPSPHQESRWLERQAALPFQATAGAWQVETLVSATSASLHFRNPDDPFFNRADSRAEELRARAAASTTVGSGSWVAAGADWSRTSATSTDNTGPELTRVHLRGDAVFAQLHTAWGPLTGEAGGRFDDYQLFGRRFSPNLGVTLAVVSWLHLHASYGEGFRAPALGELFFPFVGNAALRPETSRAGELGVAVAAGPWRLDVIAFENRLRNLIEYDFLTNFDVNVGRARTRRRVRGGGTPGRPRGARQRHRARGARS
jgi:vitamin B12 transporter